MCNSAYLLDILFNSFEFLNSSLFHWHLICTLVLSMYFLPVFLFKNYFMYMNIWSVCLCTMCMPGTQGGQTWASNPLELELQVFMNCCVGARNWSGFCARAAIALTHWAVSSAYFLYMCCFYLHSQAPCYLILFSVLHIWSTWFGKMLID